VKVFRPRRLSAARGAADPASDLQSRVQQAEQREKRHHLLPKVHRPRQNVLGRRGEGRAKRQVPVRVLNRFRHRNAAQELDLNASAHRQLPVRVNVSSAAEVRRLESIDRSPRHLVEDLREKGAANEKECRALTLSRPRRTKVVARLVQLGTDRHNRKAERKSQREEHHRQGPKQFQRNCDDGSGTNIPEPFFRSLDAARAFAHGRAGNPLPAVAGRHSARTGVRALP
jgi:hypothetical protein